MEIQLSTAIWIRKSELVINLRDDWASELFLHSTNVIFSELAIKMVSSNEAREFKMSKLPIFLYFFNKVGNNIIHTQNSNLW